VKGTVGSQSPIRHQVGDIANAQSILNYPCFVAQLAPALVEFTFSVSLLLIKPRAKQVAFVSLNPHDNLLKKVIVPFCRLKN
jgi:hypothetical protein